MYTNTEFNVLKILFVIENDSFIFGHGDDNSPIDREPSDKIKKLVSELSEEYRKEFNF